MTWIAAREIDGGDFVFNDRDVDMFAPEIRTHASGRRVAYTKVVWREHKRTSTVLRLEYGTLVETLKDKLDMRQ